MNEKNNNPKAGHWILAKIGKKVLRPGGIELTKNLINGLKITKQDKVVEFAPGLGITAAMSLSKSPKSYTGIEVNASAAGFARKRIEKEAHRDTAFKIIVADAENSKLDSTSASKVYVEAMLTMQSSEKKKKIVSEAWRILQKGGYYGIHELGLYPDNLDESVKREVRKDLAKTIQVDARPLTVKEWTELLEEAGFKVIHTSTNAMHLLERKRMIADEGFFRFIKIMFNLMINAKARKRVLSMRRVFRKHQQHLNAVCLVAVKE